MPAPTITALPAAPLRTMNPATFIATAEAWVDALGDFVTEANAFGTFMNGLEAGATDWGDISGTLASQTDLQSALDDKADAAKFVTLADQAAYDALGTPDADTYYFIPEA